jgi:hypothetical protein
MGRQFFGDFLVAVDKKVTRSIHAVESESTFLISIELQKLAQPDSESTFTISA